MSDTRKLRLQPPVVHRDLKPDKVIRRRADPARRRRVVMRLAKLLDSPVTPDEAA